MSFYFVKQHDQSDCGAACLTMVLGNLGCKLSLSKLREEIKTDINGSTIYGISKAAESYGLKSHALCGTIEEFHEEIEKENITLPVIANVLSQDGYSHFIVIYKYKKGTFYIADPALHTKTIKLDELKKIWIGNIISFSDCDKVSKRNDTRHKMDKYIKICMKNKKYIIIVAVLSLFVACIGTIGALVFEYVIDGIYNNSFIESEYIFVADFETDSIDKLILNIVTTVFPTLGKLCVAIIVLYLFQGLMSFLQSYLLAVMSKKINIPVMMSFYEHITHVPLNFYSGRRTGDILSRFNDASGICQSISSIILNVIVNATLAAFYGFFLFCISPRMFIIVLINCFIYFSVIYIFKDKLKSNQLDILSQKADVSSNLKETIDGIKTIKAYQMEDSIQSKFVKVFSKLVNKIFSGTLLGTMQSQIVGFISSTNKILILWIGVKLCMCDSLEVSALITFYVMSSTFIEPVKSLIALQPQVQSVLVSAERLNDVFDIERETESKNTAKLCDRIETLSFNNMTFAYGYNDPIFNDTVFEIKQGERIAVQGKNGCGKTTLASIIMGLYQSDEGNIYLNGNPISFTDFRNYTSRIAYIPQESFFFSDTIYNNLTFGNDNVTEKDISVVINLCCLSEYISSLPQGINTCLEENGVNLSAGTKQKLAIARALLRKPEIFILDESTSNIDIESEREIEKVFENLNNAVSVIDISHKIYNFDKYDKVYMLENGKLSLKNKG